MQLIPSIYPFIYEIFMPHETDKVETVMLVVC